MITGLDTALGEITLVFFTAVAPSGVVAYIIMAGILAFGRLDAGESQRVKIFMSIPLVTSMVGLIASSTHLGNPENALYVFMGVGRSPLSNEVFTAVIFLAFAGFFWLYSFSQTPRRMFEKLWLVLTMLSGIAFIVMIAYAYAVETIVSWYTVFVPLNLMLSALVGGPVLALLSLRVAKTRYASSRFALFLCGLSALALVANLVVSFVQNSMMADVRNSIVALTDLVPYYGIMVAAFGILSACAIGLLAVPLFRAVRVARVPSTEGALEGEYAFSSIRGILACLLVFSGIFIVRFGFYMMHMTVGLSL